MALDRRQRMSYLHAEITKKPWHEAAMFISFREAADLGLQIVLALTLTLSGMVVASYA